MEKVLVR